MHGIGDIREYKHNLREIYKNKRRSFSPDVKARLDGLILGRILELEEYKSCHTIVTYVSTQIEVDTRTLIKQAIADGKKVSVPRCVPGTRDMEFYYIRSLDELEAGSFSVDEPNCEKSEKTTDFTGSLCIVPGLCYDRQGYRLGYGKGYYDRFLSNFPGEMIGICYRSCMRDKIIRGRYDHKVDKIVTERYVLSTRSKKEQ